MHTLEGLFPANTTPDDGFRPLSYPQFMHYFLIPEVAASLIAQDLNTTMLSKGYYCMLLTSDLGELQYPVMDDDDELDEIYQTNLILFNRLGKKPAFDQPRPAVIPREEDVEAAAKLLFRLKHPAVEEVRRPATRLY